MRQPIEFQAEILKQVGIDACYVNFPFDVYEIFKMKGQVKIKAYVEGELYRGSLANMGGGCHVLGITQAIRKKIGKKEGDIVQVSLQQDFAERQDIIPGDLQKVLRKTMKHLNFSMRYPLQSKKEYVNWINSAKKEETRKKRIEVLVERLNEGKKNLRK